MKIGIVGSEAAKFTKLGEERARDAIKHIVNSPDCTGVVSGHCHLGGVDIFAEDIAKELGKFDPALIFPPKEHNWSYGYKPRNLDIVRHSDLVYCITVVSLPDKYVGMKFNGCYHCAKFDKACKEPHIKSGGCWTVIQGMKVGKEGKWIVIAND